MTPPADSLASFRARIDALDAQLLALLATRRALVAEIFAFKDAHGLSRIDAAREAALIASRRDEAERLGVPPAVTEAVFRAILDDARART